jgi:subtilisin family serine protease
MLRSPLLGLAAAALLAASALAAPPGQGWNYLPNDDIGAVDFKRAHPTWDGRGAVVAILDTGVDAYMPGMLATSTGDMKLIEARDFSSQGDWKTEEAEFADGVYKNEDGFTLRGAPSLAVPPIADDPLDHPVYIGTIRETQFVNNPEVNDLNDDGDTSDVFGFLVYLADRAAVEAALGTGRGLEFYQGLNAIAAKSVAAERQSTKVWLVVVDANANGDLADEPILRDYHVNFDTFALGGESAPDARALMAWEVNVLENETQRGAAEAPTAEFHFDDGSHGSHCSGIAAGFEVSGQAGLDGVAPGAWVISCKIGDNRLAGGATRTESMKKAYEYVVEFGERWGLPVVVNMSFGISAVEEGEDSMGKWLDDLLADHPEVTVCTSAGNEGPGLSSVGLPATSQSVISSGAYLSIGAAADLYDARLPRNTLFAFSSRGGESAKPDVVAPGGALSTVPGYVEGDARFNGTSMASPATAGAVACLMSAVLQEGLTAHWGIYKRALIASATPLPGLGLLDQGGGLVNLLAAWPVVRDLARSQSAQKVLGYKIETPCPFQADGLSDAAYWRTPGGAPSNPEQVTFTVRPVFHPDLTPDEKDTLFRSFTFKSEAPWLKVVSGKRYVRGDMGMTVDVEYDGAALKAPGVHAARVIASLDGGDLSGLAGREFALWNTVVVGERLEAANGFSRTWESKDLPASWVHRYFVDVPAGASGLRVRLEAGARVGASRGARVVAQINDPEGHVKGGFGGLASQNNPVVDLVVPTAEVVPGTWEVTVASVRTADDTGAYRLTASCDAYQAQPATVTELPRDGAGEAATATLMVTRAYPGVFKGTVEAVLDGFHRAWDAEVKKSDTWTHDFTLTTATPRAEFRLELDEKTANLFTDCAVNILDADGKAVVQAGFDGLSADIAASLPEGVAEASFKLQVVGAFALAEDTADWGFAAEETYLFAAPSYAELKRAGGGALRLYCGVPTEIEIKFPGVWPAAPEKMGYAGKVRFLDQDLADKLPGDKAGRLVLEVPIRLGG